MSLAFSMPPMRCCRPAVPGIAQGRARSSGSRRYGRKTGSPALSVPLLADANCGSIAGMDSMSGISHGSAPLAI